MYDAEDITGAAFLTLVAPSGLNSFLESVVKISSDFQHVRVEACIVGHY
jgi:hypothetical protein